VGFIEQTEWQLINARGHNTGRWAGMSNPHVTC